MKFLSILYSSAFIPIISTQFIVLQAIFTLAARGNCWVEWNSIAKKKEFKIKAQLALHYCDTM